MAKQKKLTPSSANENSLPRRRSPVDLRVHGSEIWLSGRFHRWQATAFTGVDLDEVSVRIAVDSTSPDHLSELSAGPRGELLSFRTGDVKKVNASLYRAQGELGTSTGKHPFEMKIEVPEGHNAFFALSFTANKAVLGDAWAELVTGGFDGGGIDAERRLDPWAGVRDSELAAA